MGKFEKGHVGYWRGKIKPISEKTKKKIRETLKGHLVSKKTRERISISNKGRTVWNKGKPWSDEMKKRISETNKRNGIEPKLKFVGRGDKHPRWKGGYENDLMLNKKRRVSLMNASGSHSLGEWQILKAQYNWTCPSCKKSEPQIKLTEDHIIPLSKGGSDNIENIQPLCRSCNSRKGNRFSEKYSK